MNLAVNARDAMPDGGTLRIETSNITLGQDYVDKKLVVKPGKYILLTVTDSGSGIDQNTQARIFEPFFTTKELGRGTGLGLSTVYGIVKQHDGYIWVYSEPDYGTTFKIYLPLVDEQGEGLTPRITQDAAPPGSETILVVEDSGMVRELIERVLTKLGYTVMTAANPDEAEQLFAQFGDPIDLLLTDLVLPDRSGHELQELLVEQQPSLKVLYMSGYTRNTSVHRSLRHLDTPYIPKPFNSTALAQKIREVLDQEKHKRRDSG